MKTKLSDQDLATRVIVSGIHFDLTPALRQAAITKIVAVLRHEKNLVRARIDLELERGRRGEDQFIAKGHLEIKGPDVVAQVESEDAYKSIDLLVDKLSELLRRRHQEAVDTRNNIRRHASADSDRGE